jgi:hypothetical protein
MFSGEVTVKRRPQSPAQAPKEGAKPQVDDRAPGVLARSTYQELRDGGLSDTDIMAFAGELLSLVASEVRSQAAAE